MVKIVSPSNGEQLDTS